MANVTLSVPILLEAARVAASVSDSDFKSQIDHNVSEAFNGFVDEDDSDFETASESDLDSDAGSAGSQDSDASLDSSTSTTPRSLSPASSPVTPPDQSIPPLPYLPGAAEKQHPPVLTTRAFASLTTERRIQARAKLHAVISSQKPWRPPLGQLASAASAVANANASKPDEDDESAAAVQSVEVNSKPIVADEATIKKRTKQIGTLSLITASSGWDIKLRELVMREAKIGDPERTVVRQAAAVEEIPSTPAKAVTFGVDVNAPIIARASSNINAENDSLAVPGLSYVRRSSVFSSAPNAPGMARTMSMSASDAEPMFPPFRRSSVFSTSANAPNPLLRERKSASSLSSVPITGDLPSAAPAADYEVDEMDPVQQQQLSRYLQQRRKTEFATIVSGYDERLREIVMEAEKSQQNRTRQRSRYNIFSEEDGDVADTESDSDQNSTPKVSHKRNVSAGYTFPPINSDQNTQPQKIGHKRNVSANYTFPPINTVSLPPVIPNSPSPVATPTATQTPPPINTAPPSPPKKTPILVPLNDGGQDRTNRRGHSLNISLIESQTAISKASKSRSRSRHGVRLVSTSLDPEGFSRERRRSSTMNPEDFPRERRRSSTMNPEDFPRERRKSKVSNSDEAPLERRKSRGSRSDSRGDIMRARSSSRTRQFPAVAIEERDEDEQPDEQSHASSISETEASRGRSFASKVDSDEERGRRMKKVPVSEVAAKLKMELSQNRETVRTVDMNRSMSNTSTVSNTSTSSTTIKRRSFIPNLGVLDAIKRSMSPEIDESRILPYLHSSAAPAESSDTAVLFTKPETSTTATIIPNLGVLDAIKKTVLLAQHPMYEEPLPAESSTAVSQPGELSEPKLTSIIPNFKVLDTLKTLSNRDSSDTANEGESQRPPIIPNLGVMDVIKNISGTTPPNGKSGIVTEPTKTKTVAKKPSLGRTAQVAAASNKVASSGRIATTPGSGRSTPPASGRSTPPASNNGRATPPGSGRSTPPASNARTTAAPVTTQKTVAGTKQPVKPLTSTTTTTRTALTTVKKSATPVPPKSAVAKSLKEQLEKNRMSEMRK